jgi:hypothetical protein
MQGENLVLSADNFNLLIIEKYESVIQQKIENVTKELETWSHKNNRIINAEKTITWPFYYIKYTSFKTTSNFQMYGYCL